MRLEPPYGKCRHSQKSQYKSNVFEELYPTKYSSSVSNKCIDIEMELIQIAMLSLCLRIYKLIYN